MGLNIKFLRSDIKSFYTEKKYSTDSGYDIVIPDDITIPENSISNKISLGIACEPLNDHGYILMPRSSIVKTPLRQSNNFGLIDMNYRGEIIVYVDNNTNTPYNIKAGTKLFQIVFPDYKPFNVYFVDELSETDRGCNGFGSTSQ